MDEIAPGWRPTLWNLGLAANAQAKFHHRLPLLAAKIGAMPGTVAGRKLMFYPLIPGWGAGLRRRGQRRVRLITPA